MDAAQLRKALANLAESGSIFFQPPKSLPKNLKGRKLSLRVGLGSESESTWWGASLAASAPRRGPSRASVPRFWDHPMR
eukprot:4908944-Prymnesium_polylepis.2